MDRRKLDRNWGIGLSVARKGIILVWLPMGLQLLALFFTGCWLVGEFKELQKQHQQHQLQENAQKVLAEAINLGFMTAQQERLHEDSYLYEFARHISEMKSALAALEADYKSADRKFVDKLKADAKRLAATATSFSDRLKYSTDDSPQAAEALAENRQKLSDDIKSMQLDAQQLQQELLLSSGEDAETLTNSGLRILLLIAAITGANIMLAILMGSWFSRGITGRLKLLMDNTYRLSRSQPLHPRLPGGDEIAHLDSVFHDMANALAEAARKERAVIRHAADVICSIDEHRRFTAISPASLHVLGYNPEELIGRKFTEILVEDDRECADRMYAQIMADSSDPQPFQNRVVRKDGTVVHILWSAYWAPSEQAMFCVAHDITERQYAEDQLKASEARTRSIFESAPVALLVVDRNGVIELTNPKAEQMFGYQMEDLIGQHVRALLPDVGKFTCDSPQVAGFRSISDRARESMAHDAAGRVFPVELTVQIYDTDEGERFLAAVLDISERHEVERLRRDFVSTVSHELRTPLTAIRGSLTLLAVGALGKLSDQGDQAVKIAERNCLRLINLINDLLDIEKLEAGKLEMIFEDVLLQSVLERSLDAVKGFADQYTISLDVQRCEGSVFADPDRLVQVFVNLLSNAIKYSPRGQTVTIRASRESGFFRVSVIDHGRGIPADFVSLVFERFQQVESDDWKRQGGGTGLGLAICKAIIEKHDGLIGVDSLPDKGSTFWVEIPESGSTQAARLATRQAEKSVL